MEIRHKTTGALLHHSDDDLDILFLPHLCLRGADLAGMDLSGAHLLGADLTGAMLRGADLSFTDLVRTTLQGACLAWANLNTADLTLADLRGADLRGADLSGATLFGANLQDADLSGAKLPGADLSEAQLQGARLCGVRYDAATQWSCGMEPLPADMVRVPCPWPSPPSAGRAAQGPHRPGERRAGGGASPAVRRLAEKYGVSMPEVRLFTDLLLADEEDEACAEQRPSPTRGGAGTRRPVT